MTLFARKKVYFSGLKKDPLFFPVVDVIQFLHCGPQNYYFHDPFRWSGCCVETHGMVYKEPLSRKCQSCA